MIECSQVYFLKAAPSEKKYKGWTCGGSIVSPDLIITSAACVEDVKHMYVIAGYKKFVEAENIDEDKCTKQRKKKIVFTCVPKIYELEFTKIEKWATTDIAVVKVESPFDFNDKSYEKDCSYTPAPIRVNYEQKYQKVDIEAMVLGWGHPEKWRSLHDYKSYNSEILQYASTTIINKEKCKKEYKSVEETAQNKAFLRIIDKYMICTLQAGNLDDGGELIEQSVPNQEGCITKIEKLSGALGATCEEDSSEEDETPDEKTESEETIVTPASRREKVETTTESHIIVPNIPDPVEESTEDIIELDEGKGEIVVIERRRNVSNWEPKIRRRSSSRRNGICQNDHGGPLVTWVGGHLVLLGVASVFKLVNGTTCAGPYLFTSTQCNGKFLDCILQEVLSTPGNSTKSRYRRSCDAPPAESGYYMVKRRISWIGHPDGPAENEILEMRPQVPISKYYKSVDHQ